VVHFKNATCQQHLPFELWGKHCIEIISRLLSHGADKSADANARQDDSWTSLHLVAFNSHLEIARILLEHGADINAQNNDREVLLR
jgi:ankyrin repeat protein